MKAGAPDNPFIDPEGYRAFIGRSEAAFREELAKEMAGKK